MTYSSANKGNSEEQVICPNCDGPLAQNETGLLECPKCGIFTVGYVGDLPDCPRCKQRIVSYKPLTGLRGKSSLQGNFLVEPCGHIVPGSEFDTLQLAKQTEHKIS